MRFPIRVRWHLYIESGGPGKTDENPYVNSLTLGDNDRGIPNPSGQCYRAPPEMHPSKMFEIWEHPQFKQLHGHKIPMNTTNSPDRLNLYIFNLCLSYNSFVSVHDIQQKQHLNKISVDAFTHHGGQHYVANAMLSSHARVMVVPPFAPHDVIRGHVNHVITIMTLNSFTEFKNLYCPEQCIFHSDWACC